MRYDGIDAFGNPCHDPRHRSAAQGAGPARAQLRSRRQAAAVRSGGDLQPGTASMTALDMRRTRARPRRHPVPLRLAADDAHRARSPTMRAVSFPPGRPVLEAAIDLNRRIFDDFKFDATRDRHFDADRAGVQAEARRVPGLRASGARLSAGHARAGALCQRLYPDAAAARAAALAGCGRLARLDLRLVAGNGLGRSSIRPTASSSPTSTSPSPTAATTTTSARSAACCLAAANIPSPSVSMSCPWADVPYLVRVRTWIVWNLKVAASAA